MRPRLSPKYESRDIIFILAVEEKTGMCRTRTLNIDVFKMNKKIFYGLEFRETQKIRRRTIDSRAAVAGETTSDHGRGL